MASVRTGTGPLVALAALTGLGACDPAPQGDAPAPPAEAGPTCAIPDPPEIALHRLNRTEYDRSVADLLHVDLAPARAFPDDDLAHGYDNISAAQALSPLLVESWSSAAHAVAEAALARDPWSFEVSLHDDVDGLGETFEVASDTLGPWALINRADAVWTFPAELPVGGYYAVEAEVLWVVGWENDEGGGPMIPGLELGIDGSEKGDVGIGFDATFDEGTWVRWEVPLQAGAHDVTIELEHANGSSVALRRVRIEGPLDDPRAWDSEARLATVPCDLTHPDDGAACAHQVVDALAPRAWRRPLEASESERLHDLVDLALDQGDAPEVGLELAIRAMLLSPKFLFHVERDDAHAPGEVRPLSDHELATRLAAFLWSSIPDDALRACADAGDLTAASPTDEACALDAQVARMLDDPRADALVDDFVPQWLGLRALSDVYRDPATHPGFDPALVDDMAEEPLRLAATLREEARPWVGMLDAGFTWVTPELAAHYGLDHPTGTGWARVELPDAQRSGVLRQGAFATATGQPTRTSPVKRGQWLLLRMLCDPVDEPPPTIPPLDEDAAAMDVRETLEAHAADPVCASCHDILDPLGLAFEHYDATGAWRDEAGGSAVDASGVLPDGRGFDDADGLIAHLTDDPAVATCMAQHLATWALAREVDATPDKGEPSDACLLEHVQWQAAQSGGTLDALAAALATSPHLTHRTTKEDTPDAP